MSEIIHLLQNIQDDNQQKTQQITELNKTIEQLQDSISNLKLKPINVNDTKLEIT
jgi:septal ring factor EnvC (AmiA/AmiB activator)